MQVCTAGTSGYLCPEQAQCAELWGHVVQWDATERGPDR